MILSAREQYLKNYLVTKKNQEGRSQSSEKAFAFSAKQVLCKGALPAFLAFTGKELEGDDGIFQYPKPLSGVKHTFKGMERLDHRSWSNRPAGDTEAIQRKMSLRDDK